MIISEGLKSSQRGMLPVSFPCNAYDISIKKENGRKMKWKNERKERERRMKRKKKVILCHPLLDNWCI